MSVENYNDLPPNVGESKRAYCLRLQELGHDEMCMRKALAYHFHVDLAEHATFINEFELARLRHLTMLRHLASRKNSWNFGLRDMKRRERWPRSA
ncbi:MAG: hypothetical protein ABJO27_09380 [Pseudoruegeria sp.]